MANHVHVTHFVADDKMTHLPSTSNRRLLIDFDLEVYTSANVDFPLLIFKRVKSIRHLLLAILLRITPINIDSEDT